MKNIKNPFLEICVEVCDMFMEARGYKDYTIKELTNEMLNVKDKLCKLKKNNYIAFMDVDGESFIEIYLNNYKRINLSRMYRDTKRWSGFRYVYSINNDEVGVCMDMDYTIPSDELMEKYIIYNGSLLDLRKRNNESFTDMINRKFSLCLYRSTGGEVANNECYGTEKNRDLSFDFFYQERDNNGKLYLAKETMAPELSILFEVEKQINWFDFPLKRYYNMSFNEFSKTYILNSFPEEANRSMINNIIEEDDIISSLIKFTSNNVVQFKYVPWHKDIIFGCFSFLDLIDNIELFTKSELDEAQKVLDTINESSMKKLIDMPKK